ncbi:MAG TPA: MBOAT family O-acyltransferase [Perlabentimonas sp.]|nr:MBOAT family O-acyltransferase [Tenuifilaceae bacterium]HZJ74811.1 MBOAT family O-acyltransferase [Perlabentimonas sp.]
MSNLGAYIGQFFTYNETRPLLFTEGSFWIFFSILLLGYSLVYKKGFGRSLYLLLFSLFFYYKSSGLYFVLLIFSTVCDYVLGLYIHKSTERWKRKMYVTISVFINLFVLSFFKYSYFFTNCINSLFQTNLKPFNFLAHLSNAIAGTHFDITSILLPVGISFFTFQTISYTVDIYRGKVKPVKNIVDFGFYVSFFPQLVAGPIVRASEFIPQLYKKFSLTKREFGHALFLILNGLIKKIIISDYISINFVDRVFGSPLSYSGLENLMATYGYSMQIYCDFSGYTDIAIGIALLVGFRLPINFNSPYKAVNITDFWRRWHISLSSWLRDYLYIPLGGNRKGKTRTYINLMLTMLLGGLWHGASTRFIIWGGIHGLSLVIHKLWRKAFPKNKWRAYRWKHIVSGILTFHIVSFAWIFFRAETTSKAMDMFGQITSRFGWQSFGTVITSYAPILLLIVGALAIHLLPVRWKEAYRGLFIKTPLWVKIVITIMVAIVIMQFKTADIQPFIYFRF